MLLLSVSVERGNAVLKRMWSKSAYNRNSKWRAVAICYIWGLGWNPKPKCYKLLTLTYELIQKITILAQITRPGCTAVFALIHLLHTSCTHN